MKAVFNFSGNSASSSKEVSFDSSVANIFDFLIVNGNFFVLRGKSGYVYFNRDKYSDVTMVSSRYNIGFSKAHQNKVDTNLASGGADYRPWFYYGEIRKKTPMGNNGGVVEFAQSTSGSNLSNTIPAFQNNFGWLWLDNEAWGKLNATSGAIAVSMIGFSEADIPKEILEQIADIVDDPALPEKIIQKSQKSQAMPAVLGIAGTSIIGYAAFAPAAKLNGRRLNGIKLSKKQKIMIAGGSGLLVLAAVLYVANEKYNKGI